MDKPVIANIETDQVSLFADSEEYKKNLRSIVNRVYCLFFSGYGFSITLHYINLYKELLVDMREEISRFVVAYFFESKYKGACA